MTNELKSKCKRGLLAGGAILAGVLVVRAASSSTPADGCCPGSPAGTELQGQTAVTSPNDVLVTVNGTAITRAEADAELQAALGIRAERMSRLDLAAARAELEPRVLDMLVTQTLLQQAADAENMTVSEEEMADAVERVSSRLPEGATLDDLKQSLGMSEEQWTDELKQNLRIEKLLETRAGSIVEPSDSEIEAFYADNPKLFEVPELVEASHILITVDPLADEATRTEKKQQAEALRERLTADNAESFETVAKEASDCPSAAEGGHLGKFARGQMVPAFEEAAFSQEPGVIGPVVETQFGYHIIKVESRTPAKTLQLDEVREKIAAQLQSEKRAEAFEAYVNQLRSNASIQNADEAKSA